MIRRRKPLRRGKRPRAVRKGHEGRKECDALWSELIRKRAGGRCERRIIEALEETCGSTRYLQAHHPVSRGRKATRHDPENGIALCRACHFWAHNHLPASSASGWYGAHGIDVEALERRADVRGYRPDYAAIKLMLEAELRRLDSRGIMEGAAHA